MIPNLNRLIPIFAICWASLLHAQEIVETWVIVPGPESGRPVWAVAQVNSLKGEYAGISTLLIMLDQVFKAKVVVNFSPYLNTEGTLNVIRFDGVADTSVGFPKVFEDLMKAIFSSDLSSLEIVPAVPLEYLASPKKTLFFSENVVLVLNKSASPAPFKRVVSLSNRLLENRSFLLNKSEDLKSILKEDSQWGDVTRLWQNILLRDINVISVEAVPSFGFIVVKLPSSKQQEFLDVCSGILTNGGD